MLNNIKLENALKILSQNKQKWLKLNIQQKISYLESAMDSLILESKQWAEVSARAKEGSANSDIVGQEFLAGPAILMRQLRYLIQALKENGKPTPKKIFQRDNKQFVAKVMPENIKESLIWRGFESEVWIQKDKFPTQGVVYSENNTIPAVSLILGAGNVSSISPLDALTKLYNEGKVCIVKLNPVNDYLLEIFNKIFVDLIHDGFLYFTKGTGEIGEYLCNHNLVDDIHITGSHITHDKIVWGKGTVEEINEKKLNDTMICNKNITSELGCVTPVIIVPGIWTDEELIYHARQIASVVANNASFNCNAMKVIVTCKGWQQRELFLNYLRIELKSTPSRKAYYPGAWERYSGFLKQYNQAEIIGDNKAGCIPWTLIPDINSNNYAFENEAFCGIITETSINANNVTEFIHKAVDFCNDKIWGTLSCSLLVDPLTKKIHHNDIEYALETLRYGTIGVNCWSALSYAFASTTWGAFPGATLKDIQSGIGTVHNGLLFDFPEKSVIHAPFTIWPTPAWFYTNKNTLEIAECLIEYEYSQSVYSMMKLIFAALKG
ncbi:NAD-dependent aldehyde dehydrogenase [Silvanigrella paludirubra]|uniref:NAD-dependent aldehyde dehydrogenase n=1 Tax=Silvanigrella paludirubra TaxID=2499159 RepID=A0A6N6VWY0_9BACT|nr:NAD-dependent aldehyde dehydrogenase [Silvanigrella paludirubra]KAB8039189.1 NAD-dependent aldehyde dehydrogenase [Silvanigrella paludirubra]